jgi:hypothetical protein
MNLMMALEQSLPQPVMAGIMKLMAEDVGQEQVGQAQITEEIEDEDELTLDE